MAYAVPGLTRVGVGLAGVSFSGVGKVYPDGSRAVQDLTLDVGDGEFVVLVGPSGCGKTTALRMIAGLETITEGEIVIGDRVVNDVEPRKRDVAMVFQNYALYPHMTVFENIAFPLRSRRVAQAEIRERVENVSALLGLRDLLGRRPRMLSGGQRQRVAMGRAIVRQPQVFLMDEPLSNLDAKLRVQMRMEISRLQRELGVTTVYVTHDQVEALTMSDRIAVMRKGVLQQYGRPQDVYDHPRNLFVATFIGSPAMNIFRARVEQFGDGLACVLGDGGAKLALSARWLSANGDGLAQYCGRDVAVGIRPEHLCNIYGGGGGPSLRGKIVLVETLGSERAVHMKIEAESVVTDALIEIAQDVDATALQALGLEAGAHHAQVAARLPSELRAEVGNQVEVEVRPDRLHFFDITTGAAVAPVASS
jgi:multiple sugar transport system ATP-binding protein